MILTMNQVKKHVEEIGAKVIDGLSMNATEWQLTMVGGTTIIAEGTEYAIVDTEASLSAEGVDEVHLVTSDLEEVLDFYRTEEEEEMEEPVAVVLEGDIVATTIEELESRTKKCIASMRSLFRRKEYTVETTTVGGNSRVTFTKGNRQFVFILTSFGATGTAKVLSTVVELTEADVNSQVKIIAEVDMNQDRYSKIKSDLYKLTDDVRELVKARLEETLVIIEEPSVNNELTEALAKIAELEAKVAELTNQNEALKESLLVACNNVTPSTVAVTVSNIDGEKTSTEIYREFRGAKGKCLFRSTRYLHDKLIELGYITDGCELTTKAEEINLQHDGKRLRWDMSAVISFQEVLTGLGC